MRTGARIIVGAGAALTGAGGAEAAKAAPETDSPTAAQQRQIRADHLAKAAQPPAPAPPRAPVPAPAPAPAPVKTLTNAPPPPPPATPKPAPKPVAPAPSAVREPQIRERPLPEPPAAPVAQPTPKRGSDGLTPGQRRLIDEDRRAAAAAAPSEPTPAPPAAQPAPRQGADGLTPGQRRLIDEDRRAAAAVPPPEPPEPPVVQPTPERGADGLTPGQRRLIQEDRRAAEPQPPAMEDLTPGQRRLIEEDRRAAEAQPDVPVGPPVEAEVMNWNLGRGASQHGDGHHHGKGTDPNEVDDVAGEIAEELPDVVTLQEVFVEYDVAPHGHEDDVEKIVRLIEEETGVTYHVARGPATVKAELDDNIVGPPYPVPPQIPGLPFVGPDLLVGDFGNVVLSREPIIREETIDLPASPDENRVVQRVATTVDGVEVTVFNTHLSTDGPARVGQLDELWRLAGQVPGAAVVAGDMNVEADPIDGRAARRGYSRASDLRGPRCTGGTRESIDHVYVTGATGRQPEPGECGTSDHPWQVVDVELPRG